MPKCSNCGGEIIFRYMDGLCTPIHLSGGCFGYNQSASKPRKKKKKQKKEPKFQVAYNNYTSFINPNASCPVCGEQVFFYQSKDGGRVFFDEIGPPWPKHPCTDNTKLSKKAKRKSIQLNSASKRIEPQWEKEGWQPFLVQEVQVTDDKRIKKIVGLIKDAEFICYVKASLRISSTSIAFIKESGFKFIYISILSDQTSHNSLKIFNESGYTEIQDLIDAENRLNEYQETKKKEEQKGKEIVVRKKRKRSKPKKVSEIKVTVIKKKSNKVNSHG